ncbi:MAG: argininosuccinate lyase [Alphaproteobacteria bacterium]|nr:argininosuccinate lyase [Alphaproteobacteria bacterium]
MRYALALLGGLAVAGFGASAHAQGKQDFTLVNATGYVISEVYVSPSAADDWEDDVLGKDTMADKETLPIKFSRKEKSCKWDLKVKYEIDNSTVVWRGFDLCEISKITIRYNKQTDTTSASTE